LSRCARLFVEPVASWAGLRCCAVVVNEISELNLDAHALLGTTLVHAGGERVEMANGCICSLSSPHSPRRSFLNRRAAATDRGEQRLDVNNKGPNGEKDVPEQQHHGRRDDGLPAARAAAAADILAFVGQHLNTRSGPSRVLLTPKGNAALLGDTWGRTDRLGSASPTRCGRGLSWNRRRTKKESPTTATTKMATATAPRRARRSDKY
jgi:hypothetical protein